MSKLSTTWPTALQRIGTDKYCWWMASTGIPPASWQLRSASPSQTPSPLLHPPWPPAAAATASHRPRGGPPATTGGGTAASATVLFAAMDYGHATSAPHPVAMPAQCQRLQGHGFAQLQVSCAANRGDVACLCKKPYPCRLYTDNCIMSSVFENMCRSARCYVTVQPS
jgi:hypothetical protein